MSVNLIWFQVFTYYLIYNLEANYLLFSFFFQITQQVEHLKQEKTLKVAFEM